MRPARVWLLALLLPLYGCFYASSVPLEAQPKNPIDPKLLGVWEFVPDPEDTEDKREENPTLLTVYQWDAHTYAVVLTEAKTTCADDVASCRCDLLFWRMHLVDLDGNVILQFQQTQHEVPSHGHGVAWGFADHYWFGRYEFAKNGDLLAHMVEEDFYQPPSAAQGSAEADQSVEHLMNPRETSAELRAHMIEHWDDPGMFEAWRLRRVPPEDRKGS